MSYVIQAVLSNSRHPECGQITIPFPIPVDQYDQTIEMLQGMELGDFTDRDCTVDEVDSHYSVLGTLNGTLVNVDQLDYLVSAPVIKCKKRPRKKCSFVAEVKGKR